MTSIGYARVSTVEQSLDLQHDALNQAGVSRIFTDEGVSGSVAVRPGLTACLDYVREGDVVCVWRLDRLGRNTRHTLELLDDLGARGVGFRSLSEGLDTSGSMGRAMLTIISAFTQLERDVIIERTTAGLASARARGRVGGRPPALTNEAEQVARSLYDGGTSVPSIARTLSVSDATIYRSLARTRDLVGSAVAFPV